MAQRTTRRDRHRIAAVPEPPAAPVVGEDIEAGAFARPAPPRARAVVGPGTGLYAPAPRNVSRPAQLSDRCMGCGASTRGRETMVTQFIQAGPVRALRVVSCSACPDKRAAED
jgi:hypothetical protein